MVKLESDIETDIFASEMQDGQIAVIVGWPSNTHIGKVVQRYDNALIILGENSGQAWPFFFNSPNLSPDCRVRIIPKGSKLVVQ